MISISPRWRTEMEWGHDERELGRKEEEKGSPIITPQRKFYLWCVTHGTKTNSGTRFFKLHLISFYIIDFVPKFCDSSTLSHVESSCYVPFFMDDGWERELERSRDEQKIWSREVRDPKTCLRKDYSSGILFVMNTKDFMRHEKGLSTRIYRILEAPHDVCKTLFTQARDIEHSLGSSGKEREKRHIGPILCTTIWNLCGDVVSLSLDLCECWVCVARDSHMSLVPLSQECTGWSSIFSFPFFLSYFFANKLGILCFLLHDCCFTLVCSGPPIWTEWTDITIRLPKSN